jgi:hypothetical protein
MTRFLDWRKVHKEKTGSRREPPDIVGPIGQ